MRLEWGKFRHLERRLVSLDFDGKSHVEIAETLTREFPNIGVVFTDDMVRNRLKRLKRIKIEDLPETKLTPWFDKYRGVIEGRAPAPEKLPVPSLDDGRSKILYMGDIHIPFQCDAAIEAAVQSNLDADVVVIGGDVTDCYALSSFEKRANYPFELEIEGLIRFYEYLHLCYPDTPVVSIGGNHHYRIKRNVQVPPSLLWLYDDDFFEAIARPFANIIPVDNWYYQVADVLFAHDEQGSAVDGKSGLTAYSWFTELKDQLGLDDFRVVVQAHVHRLAVLFRRDRKLFEGGCLCVPLAYSFGSSKYKTPSSNGWITLCLKDGRSILNECREYYWLPDNPLIPVAA